MSSASIFTQTVINSHNAVLNSVIEEYTLNMKDKEKTNTRETLLKLWEKYVLTCATQPEVTHIKVKSKAKKERKTVAEGEECQATTSKGARCKIKAKDGQEFCGRHSNFDNKPTKAKTKAKKVDSDDD